VSDRENAPLAVELVGVHKHFDGGEVRALDGLDLVVGAGEFVAVTGPSGCGKSTMLHLVAALDRPTSGTIRVAGDDLSRLHNLARYRRLQVGLVFQLHHLVPQLSAIQNVEIAMFGTVHSPNERRRRARALLETVGLAGQEHRPPTRLSGGERQRVAIARALANDPALLLADEPTGSLDEASIARVLALFADLRRKRPELTIVIVTHDPVVAASADRTVYLRAGRVDVTRTTSAIRPPGHAKVMGMVAT
jgi:putative ABC transport system ATP-binding protein